MVDTPIPISGLPAGGTLAGPEQIPAVQSGTTVRVSAQAIANLAPAASPSLLVESGPSAKISALSAGSSLAGTEVVAVVQGGATVKVSVQAIANLSTLAPPAILVESGSAAKTSGMTAAATLAGTEVVALVQGGVNVKTTAQAIANLAPAATVPAAILVESGSAQKISALSAAASLAGTEKVPILQSGATVETSVQAIANLASTGMAVTQQSGTSYALLIGDAGTKVQFTNGSAIALTIPTNASVAFPIGTNIIIMQSGAGVVTVNAAGGVTLNSYLNKVSTAGQFAQATLTKDATNTWSLVGTLA